MDVHRSSGSSSDQRTVCGGRTHTNKFQTSLEIIRQNEIANGWIWLLQRCHYSRCYMFSVYRVRVFLLRFIIIILACCHIVKGSIRKRSVDVLLAVQHKSDVLYSLFAISIFHTTRTQSRSSFQKTISSNVRMSVKAFAEFSAAFPVRAIEWL